MQPINEDIKPASVVIEVENVERIMEEIHEAAPKIQGLDLLFRILRRG